MRFDLINEKHESNMKFNCIIVLLFVLTSTLSSQRLVEREIIINPLFEEVPSIQDGETRWMSSVFGWGSFGNYAKGDYEHEWYQKLGMLIELYRLGNDASLSFGSHIEFIANDRNILGFNPRALIWEEGFLFTKRVNQSFWQIGYFHRCKHDVDNLIDGHERSLIFGGLLFKYILPVIKHVTNQWSYLALQTEIYTILQDYRLPDKYMEFYPNLEQLLGSMTINFNNNNPLSKYLGVYVNAYGSLNFFSSSSRGYFNRFKSLQTVQFSGGVSAGIAIQGGAHFRIGLNFEYFRDTTIEPIPNSSSLLSLGIMIIDPKAIL